MTGKEAREINPTVEYQDYEICPKSKVGKYIQSGTEFFIVDMNKRRVYSSYDLRLREISEKLDSDNTFVVKAAAYAEDLSHERNG